MTLYLFVFLYNSHQKFVIIFSLLPLFYIIYIVFPMKKHPFLRPKFPLSLDQYKRDIDYLDQRFLTY